MSQILRFHTSCQNILITRKCFNILRFTCHDQCQSCRHLQIHRPKCQKQPLSQACHAIQANQHQGQVGYSIRRLSGLVHPMPQLCASRKGGGGRGATDHDQLQHISDTIRLDKYKDLVLTLQKVKESKEAPQNQSDNWRESLERFDNQMAMHQSKEKLSEKRSRKKKHTDKIPVSEVANTNISIPGEEIRDTMNQKEKKPKKKQKKVKEKGALTITTRKAGKTKGKNDAQECTQNLKSLSALQVLHSNLQAIDHNDMESFSNPDAETVSELQLLLHSGNVDPALSRDIKSYLRRMQIGSTQDENISSSASMHNQLESSDIADADYIPLNSELDPHETGSVKGDGQQLDPDGVEPALWSEEDLKDPERLQNVCNKVYEVFSKDLSKAARARAIEADVQRREALFHREMASFVEASVFNGMVKRAHALLTTQYLNSKRKTKRFVRVVKDVNIYNTVMHAWAKQGELPPIRRLFIQMEELGVTPTLQSYAAVLECVGRGRGVNHEVVRHVIDDVTKAGFDLRDICATCKLQSDEWKTIEKVLRIVQPDIEVRMPSAADRDYDCELLKDLNNSIEQRVPNPYQEELSLDDLKTKAREQLRLELGDHVTVNSVQPPVMVTPDVTKARELLQGVKAEWQKVVHDSFEQSRKYLELKTRSSPQHTDLLPYLKFFPTKTYVKIILQEVDRICQEMESFSPTVTYLQGQLGQTVLRHLVTQYKVKKKHVRKISRIYQDYLTQFKEDHHDRNLRQIWQDVSHSRQDGSSLDATLTKWPHHVSKQVGKFLMDIVLSDLKVDVNLLRDTDERSDIPAFYTVFRQRNNIPQEEIMPHPVLVRLYEEAKVRELTFRPSDMPSLVPPVPWTCVTLGGNILCTTDLVKNAPPQFDVHHNVPNQQLFPVFDALNCVGSVPWQINHPILDILIDVFNRGGDPSLDIPEPASRCPPLPKFSADMTAEEKLGVIFERNKIKKKKKEMFSLWCTELYRLSIANKYRDETFWFPHNIDFRSRFYAVPPHFNHLGSDVARSMLTFAKGKPLGPNGLDWLKIHLVNLTGFKKRSANVDRLAFCNQMMPEIMDSADNPLTGNKWWQTSDEPWQTLACCMEIARASRSGEGENYICRLPVHQDGSCNGLQHYAALGRDQAGAESVNLYPFPSPKDVYSDVVELVERERALDSQAAASSRPRASDVSSEQPVGSDITPSNDPLIDDMLPSSETVIYPAGEEPLSDAAFPQAAPPDDSASSGATSGQPPETQDIARALGGFVRRKVIKQTIMTTVYGVTRYGARQQIRGQLQDIPDFPDAMVWDSMFYLTNKTFHCLQQMFTSTKEIQDWLVTCAELTSRVAYQPVEWQTPIGWPVLQPYFRHSNIKRPDNPRASISIEKPNARKQRNAFPPNFIHSLDSAHMMLTAINCTRRGTAFVAVHDCFWTHACDVNLMNQLCREQFVALHSQPILEDLAASLLEKYGYSESELAQDDPRSAEAKRFVNAVLGNIPDRGTFDIKKILESTYFFS